MNVRCHYISNKLGRHIDKVIVVSDLKNMPSAPDLDVFSYVRRCLALDQYFYPETLKKLFLVNAPWYFTAIYSIVKGLIDPDTAKKIAILGANYLPQLLELIDEETIPLEFGGKCENISWSGPWSDECGCSEEQVQEYLIASGKSVLSKF